MLRGGVEAVGRQVTRFRSVDEVLGWRAVSYAEYATAGEDHFAPKPTTGLPRFVLAEFTDENYQVVWWIMAKLCVVVVVLVAFVASPQGLVRSIPRRSAEPEPSTRPPHDEVGEHGDAPGQPAPSDLSNK